MPSPDPEPGSEQPKIAPPRFFPALTVTLLTVNILLFLLVELKGGTENPANLVLFGALIVPILRAGDFPTLLTSAFLHFGFLHLAFNMYALWVMGRLLETLFGAFRFAIIYFASAVTGSLLSLCFVKAVSGGASGAVFGVAGAMLVIGFRYRSSLPPQSLRVLGPGIVPFFLYNLAFGLAIPHINIAAHIGGAIGGAACAFVLRPHQDGKRLRRLTVVGALSIILIAFVLHLAFLAAAERGLMRISKFQSLEPNSSARVRVHPRAFPASSAQSGRRCYFFSASFICLKQVPQ